MEHVRLPRADGPVPSEPPPLHTPAAILAHLDTLVGPPARELHTAHGVLCDALDRPWAAHTLDCPEHPTVQECAGLAGEFAAALAAGQPHGKLILAVTRPGPGEVQEHDRRWFQGLNRACAVHDVRPLGMYVLTPSRGFAVTLDDVL
jgi:hypothetical protein